MQFSDCDRRQKLGSVARGMSRQYLIAGAIFVALGAPVQAAEVPVAAAPPVLKNVQERSRAFAERNSPANLEQVARTFFGMTFLSDWGDRDFNRPGRWAELKKVRALMDGGDYPAALEQYKRYTMDKLRTLDDYGLSAARFNPYSGGGPATWRWVRPLIEASERDATLAQAKDLMAGFLTLNGKRVAIGEPGTINWEAAVAAANKNWGGDWPWHVDAFSPLLAAYLFTGDHAFIDRWSAYADDWAMNQSFGAAAATIGDLPDAWAGSNDKMINLLRYINGVAMQSDGADRLPAATFARVLTKLVTDYLPISIMYHRCNTNGWTELNDANNVDLALFLDEYRCAPGLMRDALRSIDLLIPNRHMPDGADVDSTVGYAFQYPMATGPILDRLNARTMRLPEWQLASWEKRDLRENFQ